MMKEGEEHDKMTKNDAERTPGRVRQICQNFLLHGDSGLAHRLQEEEFAVHFDRNRTHRRESGLGVKTARVVEEEEKRTLVEKQFDFYQQQQKIAADDIALARQLQEEMEIKPISIDRTNFSARHHSSDEHIFYEEIDQSASYADTSNDEQLAQILQEEEQLLSSSTHRSHFKSTFV